VGGERESRGERERGRIVEHRKGGRRERQRERGGERERERERESSSFHSTYFVVIMKKTLKTSG